MAIKRGLSRGQSSMEDLEKLFSKQARVVATLKETYLPYASAQAKAFAKQNNVDPASITGTGKGKTITKKDIQDYLSNKGKAVEKAMDVVQKIATKHDLPEPDMRKLLRAMEGLLVSDRKKTKYN